MPPERKKTMMKQIEQVLDQRVRPYLHSHGGEVMVVSLEDGILRVKLLGQCSGCPSATLTTEQIIQEEVCQAVPEVKQVVLIQEVSQDLLDQARAILRGEGPGRG